MSARMNMTTCVTAVVVALLAGNGGRAYADFAFGEAATLGPTVNCSYSDGAPCISRDGLSLYFASDRSLGCGASDIWMATRPTTEDEWGPATNIGRDINSSHQEVTPALSVDGLTLFFASNRPGGHGGLDLWMTTRATSSQPWGPPENLGPLVNSPLRDVTPSLSSDGLTLYFSSRRPDGRGKADIWVATRPANDRPWEQAVNFGWVLNSEYNERGPSISADGLALFFESNRPGGYGAGDVWVTMRAASDAAWSQPLNLGPATNTASMETCPMVCADGSMLYFSSQRPGTLGGYDLWQMPILSVVDLNGDGCVGPTDVASLMESWGLCEPLCDIGPMPWGDGVVDAADLRVMAGCVGEEMYDPTLLAHWALDEADGFVACDSAGDNDGLVLGGGADAIVLEEPTWTTDGGQIAGALALDGIDDCIITKCVLNPAEGPFSVLLWVKGGAPGQGIVTQQGGGGATWLLADALDGALSTELQSAGRFHGALRSEATITDGQWHRIALTWDGVNRRLYVDGLVVAEDTQDGLAGSGGGLGIGAANSYALGTFWAGLIDDVRIYSRAVKP